MCEGEDAEGDMREQIPIFTNENLTARKRNPHRNSPLGLLIVLV